MMGSVAGWWGICKGVAWVYTPRIGVPSTPKGPACPQMGTPLRGYRSIPFLGQEVAWPKTSRTTLGYANQPNFRPGVPSYNHPP